MKKLLHPLLISLVLLGGIGIAYASPLSIESTRFETSLTAPIGSTDTAMTLVNGNNNDGVPLSGYVCFTIDSNQPNVEDVCGTAVGQFVTNMTRGISGSTGTTSVAALMSSHRRGADVKISDTPFLVILSRIVNQIDGFANPIAYDASVATTTLGSNRQNIASVGLVQDTAFNGASVINATTAAKGISQIATAVQTASSTALGSSGATLVIPASEATSTFNTATSPLKVVVTQNSGTIDPNFIGGIATTTLIGYQPAYNIGKNIQVFTAGTSSFAVPSGVKKVAVTVQAPGAPGGSCNGAIITTGGGGGGGYTFGIVDVSATTSIQVFVGATTTATTSQATWSTFGTNGFYLSALGGFPSASVVSNSSNGTGGVGGVGVGGSLNLQGQTGTSGLAYITNTTGPVFTEYNGIGGNSELGFGSTDQSTPPLGATGYGGGGAGASCPGGGSFYRTGGQATNGIVIVQW